MQRHGLRMLQVQKNQGIEMIWKVDAKVFLKEYARLIKSGMNHDKAMQILREKYGER